MSCKSFRDIWNKIDNAPIQENVDTSDVTDSDFDVDTLSNVLDIWEAYGIDVAMEHFNSLKSEKKCSCLHCL